MAQSLFTTRQFSSDHFVESCGAILLDLSDPKNKKVCLLYYAKKDLWIVAKGRRNLGESRKDAALREVMEETGYRCQLFPVTMSTRAPPIDAEADCPDESRLHSNLTEPFMCTVRDLPGGLGVKIIWWYIASMDEANGTGTLAGEADFRAEFFACDEAIEKLTFQTDRDVLSKAVDLVEQTYSQT